MRDSKSLYECMLRSKWQDLDISVQNFLRQPHADLEKSTPVLQSSADSVAMVNVGNGDWWLSRAFARLLRLPRAGKGVHVRVKRQIENHREVWSRQFPDVALVSEQWEEEGLLVEQMGRVLCHFELMVAHGSLMFRHRSTSLQVFGTRWRFPAILAPTLTGYCEPGADAASTFVHVSLWIPVARVVLSYSGDVTLSRNDCLIAENSVS